MVYPPPVKGSDEAASGLSPSGPYGVWGDSGSEKGAVDGGGPADYGTGVFGTCDGGQGVSGQSNGGTGVGGNAVSGIGVGGYSERGVGTLGNSAEGSGMLGVAGTPSTQDYGVAGVIGSSGQATGVIGLSDGLDGVKGVTSSTQHAGVSGYSEGGIGTLGNSTVGTGTLGVAGTPSTQDYGVAGVIGSSGQATGVIGLSDGLDGVKGVTSSTQHAGVAAANYSRPTGAIPSGYAVWAQSNATGIYAEGLPAGFFQGDVVVTGDVVLANSGGADVAEDFDFDDRCAEAAPGTVVVIGSDGALSASRETYDTRVAGVVSGAGSLNPAIVLQRVPSERSRVPVALMGKTYCWAEADSASIAPGDLLTTSSRPGHAMKATDRPRAVGAIIGKALEPLKEGSGLISILVSPR